MMKITTVREICYAKAQEFGFILTCPIMENTRFSTTLGRVTWNEQGKLEKIEFSAALLKTATERTIMDTILHELAHAFVYLETGEIHGHDAMFRSMCHRLGTLNDGMYAKNFELTVSKEEYYKYDIYCEKCGKLVGHRSRACKVTKNPEEFLSHCCNAGIKVVQNY